MGSTQGGKDDGGASGGPGKQKAKQTTAAETSDFKQEMEEFKDKISELYQDKVVKLMDAVEERRREEEMENIQI